MQSLECRIVEEQDVCAIQIDGKKYAPVSFKSFRPTKRNITEFYRAGVRLFQILSTGMKSQSGIPYSFYGESWLDDEVYDFTAIDRQIEFFAEHAPEGYFCLMICLDTREWWLKKHAGYPDSYTNLAQMEADPYWREKAAKYLQAVLGHVEEKYGDRVFGYVLMAGTTTEWLSENSFEEKSEFVSEAYRKWKGDAKAAVPEKTLMDALSEKVLLDCKTEREVIDYRKFASWQRADSILYFAAKAQEVIKHKKLVGVYYGYVLELWGERMYESGHLGYERVFQSDDIDMIAQPFSYGHRAQLCGSQQMVTNATLSLHKKLCFLEHDQTTCLVPEVFEGIHFEHPHKAKNIEEDVNLLRRDFMYAITNNNALWWFDMFEGWFYDKRFMDEIQNMITIYNRTVETGNKSVSEIAIVVDPESLCYTNKKSEANNVIIRQRHGFCSMGAPYDIYSVCDIENIDLKKYKLIIFTDSFKKNESVDRTVKRAREIGTTLVFVYAYNIIDEEYNLSLMSNSLGMQIEENPEKEQRLCFTNGNVTDCCVQQSCFAVSDQDVEVWARYENSKKPAVAVKREGLSKTVFAGLGNLNGIALRQILELAGVHQYLDNDAAIVYASGNMIGVYHTEEKEVLLSLLEDGEYQDVFNGNKRYVSKDRKLRIPYDGVRGKLFIRI